MTIYSNPAVARQTIDPQATDKLTAYREAFNNAPGSLVPGNRHQNYPPTAARVARDNEVQANRGRVAGEALYPYDIT
ncbi:11874_t:CDS:2, partial [Entrophospora sp. SA101]